MLADKLKSLRQSRRLTQAELASELFVSRSMIAKYETGKAYPTNEVLKRIADFFGISIDDLVQRDELIEEHSKSLDNNYIKKKWLVSVVALIGVLFVCIISILSIVEIDKTEYVVDCAQIEWDGYSAWNLYYYEESNPEIWQRRARLHLNESYNLKDGGRKVEFTIEGEDWFVQYNKYNISEDYRELKTVTLYYRVTIRKNLLGIEQGRGYYLVKADFHL